MTDPTGPGGLTAVLLQLADITARLAALDERQAGDGRRLTDRVTALAAIVSDLKGTAASHGEALTAMQELDRRLADLAGGNPDPDGEDDQPAGYQPPAAPRFWKPDGPDRDLAVAKLRAWVDQVYRPGYGHMAASLGECWEQHPLCLYILDWLSELWSRRAGGEEQPEPVVLVGAAGPGRSRQSAAYPVRQQRRDRVQELQPFLQAGPAGRQDADGLAGQQQRRRAHGGLAGRRARPGRQVSRDQLPEINRQPDRAEPVVHGGKRDSSLGEFAERHAVVAGPHDLPAVGVKPGGLPGAGIGSLGDDTVTAGRVVDGQAEIVCPRVVREPADGYLGQGLQGAGGVPGQYLVEILLAYGPGAAAQQMIFILAGLVRRASLRRRMASARGDRRDERSAAKASTGARRCKRGHPSGALILKPCSSP